jgi:hypothetical protein
MMRMPQHEMFSGPVQLSYDHPSETLPKNAAEPWNHQEEQTMDVANLGFAGACQRRWGRAHGRKELERCWFCCYPATRNLLEGLGAEEGAEDCIDKNPPRSHLGFYSALWVWFPPHAVMDDIKSGMKLVVWMRMREQVEKMRVEGNMI